MIPVSFFLLPIAQQASGSYLEGTDAEVNVLAVTAADTTILKQTAPFQAVNATPLPTNGRRLTQFVSSLDTFSSGRLS